MKHTLLILSFLLLAATSYAEQPDPAPLRTSVQTLERSGGKGVWFNSVLQPPFGNSAASFYVLTQVPTAVDPTSFEILWRSQAGLNLLRGYISEGIPIIFAPFSRQSQIQAAAINQAQFTVIADGIRAFGNGSAENALLLGPNTNVLSLIHEVRHWKDRENKPFMKDLEKSLRDFLASEGLTDTYAGIQGVTGYLIRVVLEQRGHFASYRSALKYAEAKVPFVNRAGELTTDPVEVEAGYQFEASEAEKDFTTGYQPWLFAIFTPLKMDQRLRLVKLLESFTSDESKETGLGFSSQLRVLTRP
ncbi:MAG: hypothetical protein EOP09_05095 [Proteobacteria bacterium]|nr:MAG: hypothetical protein EOP09_05095 [Pseudomonadota bacterium]